MPGKEPQLPRNVACGIVVAAKDREAREKEPGVLLVNPDKRSVLALHPADSARGVLPATFAIWSAHFEFERGSRIELLLPLAPGGHGCTEEGVAGLLWLLETAQWQCPGNSSSMAMAVANRAVLSRLLANQLTSDWQALMTGQHFCVDGSMLLDAAASGATARLFATYNAWISAGDACRGKLKNAIALATLANLH
eukprot:scaffold4.g4649.t1